MSMNHLMTLGVLILTSTLQHVGGEPVHLLIFETESAEHARASNLLASHSHDLLGIKSTVFGQGSTFNGFSSKYKAVEPLLKAMDDDTVVILSDGRDVIVNAHADQALYSAAPEASAIVDTFNELVKDQPGSVVISAEAQCCVAALTYFSPGDLFDETGARTAQACPSGKPGCMWPTDGDAKKKPWEGFMNSLAELKTGETQPDVFLNAGLMAGKPKDLLRFFAALQLDESEDDQAVMTDYLYNNPEAITLDYGQRLFGNNRWPQGMTQGGCIWDFNTQTKKLVHAEKGTSPPFVHSPGKFFECNDILAEELGQKHIEHATGLRRRLAASNYGPAANANTGTTLSPEETAGIIAGGVFVLVLIVGVVALRCCKKKGGTEKEAGPTVEIVDVNHDVAIKMKKVEPQDEVKDASITRIVIPGLANKNPMAQSKGSPKLHTLSLA